MTSPIIVVGHKNPDNDSICAAVGYAYLKNQLAARQNKQAEPNPQNKDQHAEPSKQPSKTQSAEPSKQSSKVQSIEQNKDQTAEQSKDQSKGQNNETFAYIPARLGPLPPESERVLEEANIPFPQIIGHVHARVADVMTPNPISIDRDATLLEAGRMLRQCNVRSLVVTDEEGKYFGLVTTRMIAERYISATDMMDEGGANSMAVAADLIESLGQKVADITERDVLVLDKEGLLNDAIEDLMASALREAVVLDDDGFCIGILTRSDVATRPKRKVVLVDHNETRQAATGIEEAEVVEIIDHHRIADVMTANPITFLNLPVGSTATIVTMEFRKYNVEIPEGIARVLLSAIMTDTVVLKSPTTTDIDREQANFLAKIIGCEAKDFGLQVFKYRGGEEDLPVDKLVGADAKEFQLGEATVLIAQHETVSLNDVLSREEEIREHMRALLKANNYEFVLFMITDIMAEGSQFLCEGNRRILDRVFGIKCTGSGGTWMPGVLSRKKQVAARILGA